MADLWLAIAHHILVFSLAIMLAMQAALLRDGASGTDISRLARLDLGYGATAGLIVAVGIGRVYLGAKGYIYYVENIWFWAKMATFALIGLLSIPPTLRFRAWTNALKTNAGFLPSAADIGAMRNYVVWEVRLLALVVAFAATMARYRSF